MNEQPYIGRFAPSPTGPLHFGSMVAAVGSYLQARSHGGLWLVRMEDLDPPREMPGAAGLILSTLEGFGLGWDGEVIYQSRRLERYREVLEDLVNNGQAYACSCSRKAISDTIQQQGGRPGVYPGTCRGARRPRHTRHAIRLLVSGNGGFHDLVQGEFSQDLEKEVGDFVLLRADGYYAYQLAVVVDDAEQAITEVVRGSDLLDSTPRQRYLQQQLGLPTPRYLHLPVAVNEHGQKLSKQTQAPAVDIDRPLPLLYQVLVFLGQNPPPELLDGDLESFWRWAIANWHIETIPAQTSLPAPLASPGREQ